MWPGDDTYDKLTFYAAIGTREVVIVDRDTKRPEIHRLAAGEFVPLRADAEGRLFAETMNLWFRTVEALPPRLRIEDAFDPGVCVEL